MSAPASPTPSPLLPSTTSYKAMEDSPQHHRPPPPSAPEIFASMASCGCLGRSTAFKERCCTSSAFQRFYRSIKRWFDRVVYSVRRWIASVRPYAPLTPVEEGLLADLAHSAAVENSFTEETMNRLLVEWWKLVATDGSLAPNLPRDERWKSVGFQSARPSTDFRTGGHVLLCMVQAARGYRPEFREMVEGSDGYSGSLNNRFHYPFAATAINVHYILLHYLRIIGGFSPVTKEGILATGYERKVFASAMAVTEGAFEDLFTAACMAVHSHWTEMVREEEATLMDFQESLAYGLNRVSNALVKASPVVDREGWHKILMNICISFPSLQPRSPPILPAV